MTNGEKTMKGATAGFITLRLFQMLPDSQLAWVARAWAGYVNGGIEPENVPADCLGSWVAVKEEANKIKELSAVRASAGSAGGRVRKGGVSSKPKQTEANRSKPKQTEANPSRGEERRGEYNYTPSCDPPKTETRIPPDGSRTQATKNNPPETPAEEARRLGFGAYAGVAAELRGLVPAEIPLATVYAAAMGKGLSGEDLVAWAAYHGGNNWRTGSGTGVRIGRGNVAATVTRWATTKSNFERKETRDGSDRRGGGGVRTEAAKYIDDPFS